MMNDMYMTSESTKPKKTMKKSSSFIVVVVILIVAIGALLFLYLTRDDNSYSSIEKKMVKAAKEYIEINKLVIDKETYFSASKLNFTLPSTCDALSGVLVDDNEYKAYLSCTDYESKILNNEVLDDFSLNGKEVYVIPRKVHFYDPGYNSQEEISKVGDVSEEAGVYTIYYISESNKSLARKVIIDDDEDIDYLYPTIDLIGDDTVYVIENNEYTELGVKAVDVQDGDISDNAMVSGKVDTSKIGEYNLTYTITNSKGLSNGVNRKVIVLSNQSDLYILHTMTPNGKTNKDVEVKVGINGEDYAYTLLPNGEKSEEKELTYTVQENGTYKFIAYDKMNRYVEKEIVVDNIFREGPTASCVATIYKDYVKVDVTSNSKIVKYNYIIDKTESGYNALSTYSKNITKMSNVSVDVVDAIGNNSVVKCTIKNTDPSISNGHVLYYTFDGVEFVIPRTAVDLNTFVKAITHKISQSADSANCGSACLSFAWYHAVYLQKRGISNMNLNAACHYNIGESLTTKFFKTEKEALALVQSEILHGRVAVYQVNGDKQRSHRHFVTAVGYRRSKYLAKDLEDEDILAIDSWDGKLLILGDTAKRGSFSRGQEGYRVDVLKN